MKKISSISESNAFARALYILVHLFAAPCKTTTSNDKIIGFVDTDDGLFSFLYLNLKAIRTNLAPGQSSDIRQTKQIGTMQSSF